VYRLRRRWSFRGLRDTASHLVHETRKLTNVSTHLPVIRSVWARALFLASTVVSGGILLWIDHLRTTADLHDLAPIFFALFVVYDYAGALCALLILVGAALVPSRCSFRPLLRWTGEHPGIIALSSAMFLSLGALIVYQNHPLSMDEYAQVFQSKVFASGQLAGQFPPALLNWLIPKDFQDYFLTVSPVTGKVASNYWPSFALLLTPFTWLGIPWSCNPVISGLTLIAVHRLALQLFTDVESAGLAVVLTASSPVFFANGISYYSMPAHLLASTVYALLLVKATARRSVAAGVVGSVALTLHYPVAHIIFATPWLIWVIVRKHWRQLGWIIVGYLPLCLLFGIGWFWFLGHLRHDGLSAIANGDAARALALMSSSFTQPSATVLLARLIGLAKLWLWAVPGVLLLAGVGLWKRWPDARCRVLGACALATLAGYLFVRVDQGHGWGFRYFHSAWLVLPLLSTAALARIPACQPDRLGRNGDVHTFVVACALITLVTAIPLRGAQMREFVAHQLSQLPQYSGSEPRIVIIRRDTSLYTRDLVQNDPFLRGSSIRMISRGAAADAQMIAANFPGYRRVYIDANGEVWSRQPYGR